MKINDAINKYIRINSFLLENSVLWMERLGFRSVLRVFFSWLLLKSLKSQTVDRFCLFSNSMKVYFKEKILEMVTEIVYIIFY